MVNKNTGFTLVEILLALAILGVGLVGILSVFAVGTNSVRRTVSLTEASLIAQMVFEDFKRQGHIDPTSLAVPESDIARYYSGYRAVPSSPVDVGGLPGLYRVDLDIYKDNIDDPLAQFTTYIARYEP